VRRVAFQHLNQDLFLHVPQIDDVILIITAGACHQATVAAKIRWNWVRVEDRCEYMCA
jgi:hypothetical protein